MRTADIHIWHASLDRAPAELARFERLLSPDERTRAGRFLCNVHRRRFIACRGILRRLLGEYTGLAPDGIRFAYNTHGKPELEDTTGYQATPANTPLRFNVSHCEEVALLAVTREGRIGVDLQKTFDGDAQGMAERYFSVAEQDTFEAAPEQERRRMFTRLWARKEAYLKATGRGLSGKQNEPKEVSNWLLHDWEWEIDGCTGMAALCSEHGDSCLLDRGWWMPV